MSTIARWFPVLAFLVAVAALVVAIRAGSKPTSGSSIRVEPHQIVLRDPSGRDRIRLVATDRGGQIELLDAEGGVQAALHQEDDRTALVLRPEEDEAALEVVAAGRVPAVTLRDPSRKTTVKLGATDGGGLTVTTPVGGLSLVSAPIDSGLLLYFGEMRARFMVGDNKAALTMAAPSGKPAVTLDARESGGSIHIDDRELVQPGR